MSSPMKPRQSISVSFVQEADVQQDIAPPTQSRKYKPTAIRFLTLVSFVLILAACIGSIEALLRHSTNPESWTSTNTGFKRRGEYDLYTTFVVRATPVKRNVAAPPASSQLCPTYTVGAARARQIGADREKRTLLYPTFPSEIPLPTPATTMTPAFERRVDDVKDLHRPAARSLNSTTTTSTVSPSETAGLLPIPRIENSDVIVNGSFTALSYFTALYVGPILAVVIKAFWEIIFASFKMVEPFHRLAKPDGASARQSLFVQYLSNSISLDTVRSCFSGQLLPVATTIVYVITTVLAILSASAMNVQATHNCKMPGGGYIRCLAAWVVDVKIIRAVEGLLIVCLVITIGVAIFTWSYKTGVPSNPSSIASIAALVNQDALTDDFIGADPCVSEGNLASNFEGRQCRLEDHRDDQGRFHYGITRDSDPIQRSPSQSSLGSKEPIMKWPSSNYSMNSPITAAGDNATTSLFLSRRVQTNLLDALQLISTLGLFAVILTYRFDYATDAFNAFFNSETFAPRFVLIGYATLVDTQWRRLEREIRITEPYRRMTLGPQPAQTTVLLPLNGTCWSNLPQLLFKVSRFRHVGFQTLATLVTCLSDFNIIAIATMIFSDGQTPTTFTVSSIVAIIVTGSMTLVMLLTVVWWRRTAVRLIPRAPDTVGAAVSYLCASRFTRDLNVLVDPDMTAKKRDEVVLATGWRFEFSWKVGLDGRERWCVDHDGPVNEDKGGQMVFSNSVAV